jgi:predicted metal-dependent phosphoesterase TrpH
MDTVPTPAFSTPAFVDLHCHTSWSPDSLSRPERVARAAAERGLTHLAITDHGRLEGALIARDAAPAGLTIIVGEEISTLEGDLIGLFLERPIATGMPAAEAVAAVREQAGLVGLAHPYDRFRGSTLARGRADRADGGPEDPIESIAPLVDYVEAFNARVPFGSANVRAAEWAAAHTLPGVAVSDAHTLLEVGISYVILPGPVSDADSLRAALPKAQLVTSHASYVVRAWTPIARLVQRLRGGPGTPGGPGERIAGSPS